MLSAICSVSLQGVYEKSANGNVLSRLNILSFALPKKKLSKWIQKNISSTRIVRNKRTTVLRPSLKDAPLKI